MAAPERVNQEIACQLRTVRGTQPHQHLRSKEAIYSESMAKDGTDRLMVALLWDLVCKNGLVISSTTVAVIALSSMHTRL